MSHEQNSAIRGLSNIRQLGGFKRHIGQERRNNEKHDDKLSIHDHAAAIFDVSPGTQCFRFGDATSAVLLRQLNLGSQRKLSAFGGDL